MAYEQILFAIDGHVATLTQLTLNRPERLNAWTSKMSVELADAITRCNDDPNVGAIVVTGAAEGSVPAPTFVTTSRRVSKVPSSGPARNGWRL